jgi:uncharacterized protein
MTISRRKFLAGAAIAAGGGAFSFDGFYWENRHPEITFHQWPTAKWPQAAKPLRVALIADLHLKGFGSYEKKVAGKINELKPDMLVMAGDYIEANDKFDDLLEFLALLPEDCLKFAVLGNWDHWSGIKVKEFNAAFSKLGIELLDNENKVVDSLPGPFCIIGVDDPTNGWDKMDKAFDKVSEKNFNLFLAHSPNVITKVTELPVDLLLCGHTHGGQVRIPGVKPFWLPKKCEGYIAGFYEKDGKHMYVNRGLGNSVVPIRFLCRPEITVFEICGK